MKRNKKGFTLVELVIVIAVIAILAGVMIAVFSGVVKRANESAELQKVKNEELAQKADDILKKVDNANWFSWEDFENSLAAKLTATYEKYANTSSGVTPEQLEKAVKKALEEYGAQSGQDNTSLTEAQVKAIVENALAKASLGGVTESQVRTIVNTAVAGVNGVTKAQVQSIVDAAVAKGLTAAQVAQVIADKNLASATSVSELDTKVSQVITALATVSENALTKEDVEAMIKKLLPVTVTIKATETQTLQEAFDEAVTTLVSGSTIIVESETAPQLTLTTDDITTLTIKGVDVDKLTVNAPNATIYVVSDVGTIEVTAVAQNSLHILGNVQLLNITKGRIVIEEGVVVKNVVINSEGLGDKVVVVVEKDAAVTELLNVLDAKGSIAVENKGVINQVLAEDGVPAGKAQVFNIDGGTVTDLGHSDDGNAIGYVIITDENDDSNKTFVSNEEELVAALAENSTAVYVVLTNDIVITNPVYFYNSVILDGQGYSIVSSANRSGNRIADMMSSGINVTIKNTKFDGISYSKTERGINLGYEVENVSLNLDNVTVVNAKYAMNVPGHNTALQIYISKSTLSGWAAINLWSDNYNVYVVDSTLIGTNTYTGNSNHFGTVVFESDTTQQTDLHASRVKVEMSNTTIKAVSTKGNYQTCVGFWSDAANNIASFNECDFVNEGDGTFHLWSLNPNNLFAIDGEEVEMQANGAYIFD